jgi:alkyl hydroperoxide reductase subunit AhpC
LKPCLDVLGVKAVGLCLATSDAHASWLTTDSGLESAVPNFPMVTDADLRVSALYGVISPRGSATPLLARGFLIAPDRRLRAIYEPAPAAAIDWAGIVANLRQDMVPSRIEACATRADPG